MDGMYPIFSGAKNRVRFRADVHGCTNVVNAGCVGAMNVHPDHMNVNEGVGSAAEVLSLG